MANRRTAILDAFSGLRNPDESLRDGHLSGQERHIS